MSRTIDWNEYWQGDLHPFDEVFMMQGAEIQADLLAEFLADRELERVASVGCGPAVCLLGVAERFPDVEFVGYDAAESVVEANERRRDERDLGNVRFAVDSLPSLDADERFDVVYCYATLHYVADVEDAIVSLFDRVAPGGDLVVHYQTETTREWFRMVAGEPADPPAERFTGSSQPLMNEMGMPLPVVERDGRVEVEHPGLLPSDDELDAFRERFELVLDGENLITADRIAELTGGEVENYWRLTGVTDEERPSGQNPCVVVSK